MELLANETKWTSLEDRTHPTFLETLIQKYDSGPVKLPGLPRNGPLDRLIVCSIKGFLSTPPSAINVYIPDNASNLIETYKHYALIVLGMLLKNQLINVTHAFLIFTD